MATVLIQIRALDRAPTPSFPRGLDHLGIARLTQRSMPIPSSSRATDSTS